MNVLSELHASLDRRCRPEEVAYRIKSLPGLALTAKQQAVLDKAAKRSYLARDGGRNISSMSDDFARVPPMKLATAATLFKLEQPDGLAMDEIHTFIDIADKSIGKERGRSDFRAHRLDRGARRTIGLGDLSRRRYNKLFRLACRLENKERKTLYELEKRGLVQISKARFASQLTAKEFMRDLKTAAFVAYYTARCNERSAFTISGQKSSYDEIADMLFQRCLRSASTDWWVVAHVFVTEDVVSRLTGEQQGLMLAKSFDAMARIAKLLRGVHDNSDIDLKTMTVKRGNDSSTWNALAGAWNKARDIWISYTCALGADVALSDFCPGKCMRLMAADVVAWHRLDGQQADKNQDVWNQLPPPWDVLDGTAICTRDMVTAACSACEVDPEKSGWVAMRTGPVAKPFEPTPELVHGVTVGSPILASLLRRWGAFSGKKWKPKEMVM